MSSEEQGSTGEVVANIFEFLPEQIVRDEAINLRPFANGSNGESIQELANAILEHGQIEPVVVRIDAEGKPHLVAGARRVEAISFINAGLAEGDEPYRVHAVVSLVANEDVEAWSLAWSENKDRQNMSDMDIALNIKQARELFGLVGKSGTQPLADKLGVSPAYITTHEKLLKLDAALQSSIHKGEMSVDAALKLANVPEEKRDEVISTAGRIAQSENISAGQQSQSPTTTEVPGVAHKRRSAKAGKGGAGAIKARHVSKAKRQVAGASKKAEPRTKLDLVEFIETELMGPVFGEDVHKFATYLLGWLKGEG